MPSIPIVFGLVAFAGVFLFFLGLSRMRRQAGGSEDFANRLAAYGVTTAGAQSLPPASGFREIARWAVERLPLAASPLLPVRQ